MDELMLAKMILYSFSFAARIAHSPTLSLYLQCERRSSSDFQYSDSVRLWPAAHHGPYSNARAQSHRSLSAIVEVNTFILTYLAHVIQHMKRVFIQAFNVEAADFCYSLMMGFCIPVHITILIPVGMQHVQE
jgi:hypothetical protein